MPEEDVLLFTRKMFLILNLSHGKEKSVTRSFPEWLQISLSLIKFCPVFITDKEVAYNDYAVSFSTI